MGKEFINTYHSYIKWANRPSRRLYWNLYENDKMVGVFALGSAFTQGKSVKEFMENNNLKFNEIGNNIVFCLANQQNRNAGTILLKLCRQDAIKWWYERYGDKLRAFQTFILPPRVGAIYKADNWKQIGITSGSSQKTINVTKNYQDYEKAFKKTFRDGSFAYYIYEYNETETKLIFMKLNKEKEINKIIKNII